MSITEYDAASMKTGLLLVVSRWAARWLRRRVTDSPLFSMSGIYSTLCSAMLRLCWEFVNFVTTSVLILTDPMPTALRFIPLTSLGEIVVMETKSDLCPVKWDVAPPSTIH